MGICPGSLTTIRLEGIGRDPDGNTLVCVLFIMYGSGCKRWKNPFNLRHVPAKSFCLPSKTFQRVTGFICACSLLSKSCVICFYRSRASTIVTNFALLHASNFYRFGYRFIWDTQTAYTFFLLFQFLVPHTLLKNRKSEKINEKEKH